MKKQIILFGFTFLFMFFSLHLRAQVGINADGNPPDPSAMLDVKSPVKGFLPPRVALTALNLTAPVTTPVAIGLLVFNTATAGTSPNSVTQGYYYWNGGKWVSVSTPQGSNPGDMLFWNGSAWATIPSGAYGQQLFFCDGMPRWGGCHPLLNTAPVSNITQSNAQSGGSVTSDGGSLVAERGVCWSTSVHPTITDNKTMNGNGTGDFISNLTGLSASTTYYLRAFATNSIETTYGNERTFTTNEFSGAPVTTAPVLSACPGSAIVVPVKVAGFNNIGAIALTLHYSSSALVYTGATNTSGFPGLTFNGSEQGVVTVNSSGNVGVSYPDNTVLFTLNFTFSGGSTDLTWFDNGASCQYLDGGQNILADLPMPSYYMNGKVNSREEVGTPVFAAGPASSRCQGTATVPYPATAINSTAINYTLDATSVAAGNSINPVTGTVNYTGAWSGTSVITAIAEGCNGPKASEHTVTVSVTFPVSISVTSSANPVCEGTLVTFTADPVNGGSAPFYQWKVNGANAGQNGGTFVYMPANNDVITCLLTSNAPCSNGSPATSNAISMIVNPSLPVGVTITPSTNFVCTGTSVTFNAAVIHGGTSPVFQWKVNGVEAGTNSDQYAYTPENNDLVTCVVTANATCATGSPATSNTVTMHVSLYFPVSVSIAPSANNVCAGTAVMFTATPVNEGTSPLYQWIVNGNNTGTGGATLTYIPANNDVVTCVLTSNANCTSLNPATSNAVIMSVNPLLQVGISISASANSVCAGTSVTFSATTNNGGATPSYQWMVNGINAGTNSDVFEYMPVNDDHVSCRVTSAIECPQGNPAVSNTISMLVSPLLPVSVSIAASANPVCEGTAVTFNASAINGGTAPTYQWMLNGNSIGTGGDSFTYNPANNDVVSCILTSNANCTTGNPANSNIVKLAVNQLLPVGISITSSANPVCGGTEVTFSAATDHGGVAPLFQWMVNGSNVGQNTAHFSYIPANNDVVTCKFTSDGPCVSGNPATSNAITMGVNLQLAVGSISSDQVLCTNMTPLALNGVSPLNGTSPEYQWQKSLDNNNFTDIPGATNLNYQPLTLTVTTYFRLLQNATGTCGGPLPTNIVTITINPENTAGVSISANPSGTVCPGTSVVFSATPVNGGLTPGYQWKVNGLEAGTNNPAFEFIPKDGDVVLCLMTSDQLCVTNNPATSNAITITTNTNANLQAGVTVYANPAGSVCEGTLVEYTATPLNGGTNPVYQWKVNGNLAGTNSAIYSYHPENGDEVVCILTSDLPCVVGNPATSNSLSMVVKEPLPVSIAISSSANPTCEGTLVTYTAIPVNEGSSPIYHWKVNGNNAGTNNPVFSLHPVNGDIITCVLNSNEDCISGNPATSNSITMEVISSYEANVSIGASTNPFCAGGLVNFTATHTGGGTNPVFQWKVNGEDVGGNSPSYSYNPLNSDVVSCVMNSNLLCVTKSPASSNSIIMVANPILPAGVSIAASANPTCAGSSVAFNATPVNGGANPVYQWKVNGANVGTNNITYSYPPVNGDVVTCHLLSSEVCATGNPACSNSITMSINPVNPVSVIISANPTGAVCQGTSVSFTATPTNGGTSPSYQWKVNGNGTGTNCPTLSYIPINGDVVTCVLTSGLSCSSGNPAISNALNMSVNANVVASVTIAASANPVQPNTSVTYTASGINGGTNPVYQWKVNGTVVGSNLSTYTYTPLNNDNVICIFTSSITNCVSGSPATSNTIVMNVSPGVPCPGLPSITYSGKTYYTVYIGTQCWLKENLNIGVRIDKTVVQSNNQVIEKYCYEDVESNCDVYGGLYKWDELMQYVTTEGAQGICPEGWHVPSSADFATLSTTLGGDLASGGKLKEAGTTHWQTSSYPGTNTSGFTGLPNGQLFFNQTTGLGTYSNIGKYGYFYTSTQYTTGTWAYYRSLIYQTLAFSENLNYKTTTAAVRCLKN